jgi:hypothetical protein
MVAHLNSTHEVFAASAAAAMVARLERDVYRRVIDMKRNRPTLVMHWQAEPNGRMSCHWDVDLASPKPPSVSSGI